MKTSQGTENIFRFIICIGFRHHYPLKVTSVPGVTICYTRNQAAS